MKTTDDADYKPPPHGGGKCITNKDCFMGMRYLNFLTISCVGNGTCGVNGCSCTGDYTGSYCQVIILY